MDGVERRQSANAREITVLCAVDDVAGIVHSSLDAGVYHMPDLPDAIEAWGKLRPLMAAWFTFSICLVIVAPFIIFVSLPFGVLGIVAASLHLFESCRGRSSIVGSVVTIKVLAAVIATLEFALSGRASRYVVVFSASHAPYCPYNSPQ